MSRIALLATLALSASLTSCGGKSAEETVRTFLESCEAGDKDAALNCLAKGERDGQNIGDKGPSGGWSIGKTETDGDLQIVHVAITDAGEKQDMPFVVIQEDGELRISMDRTMERMFGFSMDELKEGMEEMAGAMGEEMAGAMGEEMKKGFEELDAEFEKLEQEGDDDDQ